MARPRRGAGCNARESLPPCLGPGYCYAGKAFSEGACLLQHQAPASRRLDSLAWLEVGGVPLRQETALGS